MKERWNLERLKTQYSPVMFCNLVCSNFIYHSSKNIILPKNIPKIKSLPLHSLPNVKFLNKPQFLANFSACAPAPSVDTNLHLQPSPSLHDKIFVKQKLSLITHQVLTQPKRAELDSLPSTTPAKPYRMTLVPRTNAWPASYFCQYLNYYAEPAKHQFQSKTSEISLDQRKEELAIRVCY